MNLGLSEERPKELKDKPAEIRNRSIFEVEQLTRISCLQDENVFQELLPRECEDIFFCCARIIQARQITDIKAPIIFRSCKHTEYFLHMNLKIINVISVPNSIQRSEKKLNLPFRKACYSQSQISTNVHENLYMQNAAHLVKIYSQKQLHVPGLQSGLKEKKN